MQKFFLILVLILGINLMAELSEPITILSDFYTELSDHNSCRVQGESIFLTYKVNDAEMDEYWIYFSYSDNGGDSFQNNPIWGGEEWQISDEPVLEVDDNGDILIFFTGKENEEDTFSLYLAKSQDYGLNFDITIIQEEIDITPTLTKDVDGIYLNYLTSLSIPLSKFAYFSDTELSENADGGNESGRISWCGPDIVLGHAHSNSDVWIKQAGGGNNNGYPTFYGQYSTTGEVRIYPTGQNIEQHYCPIDDIFRNGYIQNTNHMLFNSTANAIRENGIRPFSDDIDLVVVEVDGTSFIAMEGDIVLLRVDEYPVYSWFPMNAEQAQNVINNGGNWFEDTDIVAINYIPVYDTVWTEVTGNVINQSVFVDCDLYIKGTIGGNQTWGCSGNAYITGDIVYENTIPGDAPDGFSGFDNDDNPIYDGVVNENDYFGLVSEQKIMIKYKYRDPLHNFEITGGTSGNSDNYFYGCYAALGKGDEDIYGELACHYDGTFSYEYQHPHGSTPNFVAASPYTGQDTLYKWVDLHKFVYPPDPSLPDEIAGFNIHCTMLDYNSNFSGYPYESENYINSYPNTDSIYVFPMGNDYPWYNPVWPESADSINYERGTAHIFGSIAQRRRGFMHRSGCDPYNHHNQYENYQWDIDNFHYSCSHSSTGYDKNYFYDVRLKETPPVDFPRLNDECDNTRLFVKKYMGNSELETIYEAEINDIVFGSIMAKKNDLICIAIPGGENQFLLSEDGGDSFVDLEIPIEMKGIPADLILAEDYIYVNMNLGTIEAQIWRYSFNEETWSMWHEQDISAQNDNQFLISHEGKKMLAYSNKDHSMFGILFMYSHNDDVFDQNYEWNSGLVYNYAGSSLSVNLNEQDSVFVAFNRDHYNGIFLTKGSLENLVEFELEEIPEIKPTLSNHPNPFNPTTEISFTAKDAKNAKIDIYNTKGQKVKSIAVTQSSAKQCIEGSVIWNGTDNNNHPVASGIYYYTLKLDGRTTLSRKMVLLK